MQIQEGAFLSQCDSDYGIKIKLQYKLNIKCTTELSEEFEKGASITWSGKKLGNCDKIKIDAKEPIIALWMVQDQDDDYCPISVRINLKDTSFLLSLPEGNKHNLASNGNKYVAFNMAGKFYLSSCKDLSDLLKGLKIRYALMPLS